MTTDKKPLFDEQEFWKLIDRIVDCGYLECANECKKVENFISNSIRKAQREAVMEITEELLKTEHLFVGNDDFFEGVEHTRKIFKDEIDRIRAKYQEEI